MEYNKLDSGTDLGFYDVTNDCVVNSADQNALQGSSYNKSFGNPNYNPLYDLNSDGTVNSTDLGLLNSVLDLLP